MPPQTKQQSGRRRPSASTGPIRRKSCYFCKEKIEEVDYKNYNQLRRYVSERGKIRSRRITGACRRHQNQVARAVKRAREVALLPYVSETRDSREDREDRGVEEPEGGARVERRRPLGAPRRLHTPNSSRKRFLISSFRLRISSGGAGRSFISPSGRLSFG